jgi:hypothetical protein
MSAHCRPDPISHSYFVVMIDFGRRGREAVVDPEMTRRGVIERIESREFDRIAFIHHVHDDVVEDVTNELLKEAGFYERPIPDGHLIAMAAFDTLVEQIKREVANA